MFGRNIDFFAVLFIAIAMLGLEHARSWHVSEALESIRVQHAIQIERCPISQQVLSNIFSVWH